MLLRNPGYPHANQQLIYTFQTTMFMCFPHSVLPEVASCYITTIGYPLGMTNNYIYTHTYKKRLIGMKLIYNVIYKCLYTHYMFIYLPMLLVVGNHISLWATSLLEGGSTSVKGIAGTAPRLGTQLATLEVK
jgi:hypothetical protein